jgi:TfoX/Sxy family transcriptional regulator of competence genes
MAYDEFLAERVRKLIGKRPGISEKKMFGGLAFLLHGHMACGIVGEKLMLRLGEQGAAAALEEEHVAPMDFTGKPIKTMAFVETAGMEREGDLSRWVSKALAFAKTLPPK